MSKKKKVERRGGGISPEAKPSCEAGAMRGDSGDPMSGRAHCPNAPVGTDRRAVRPQSAALPGASEELNSMLANFRVASSELRRTLGKPAKLYVRLEEIVKPTQLQVA